MSDAALLERVDALLEQASSADGLSEVMAVVREAFDADCAWLDFPCDPDSPSLRRVTLSHALRLSGALGGEHDPRGRLAHEFNNVLGIVTGFSDLALLALKQGDHTRAARHLNEVLKAGERGRDLVTELTNPGPQVENEASPTAHTHDAPHLVSREETSVPHLGRRIMIVDDEAAVGRFVAEVLHRHGFDVSTTTNPRMAAALLRAEAESIDLLITDYRMPEMSGTELMAATHAIRADLPVIICTGYSKDVNASIAREMGAAAFLNKPLNIDVLLSEVHAALNTPAA